VATPTKPTIGRRLRDAWVFLMATQPAQLIGCWHAIAAALAGGGIIISGAFSDKLVAIVTAAYAVLALVQGNLTMRKVYAPATVHELTQPLVQPSPATVNLTPDQTISAAGQTGPTTTGS
jgi:hypothetical protein